MKIKQRGSSSLSIVYCIHGNRLQFVHNRDRQNPRGAWRKDQSSTSAMADTSGGTRWSARVLGTPCSTPQEPQLQSVQDSCGAANSQKDKLKSWCAQGEGSCWSNPTCSARDGAAAGWRRPHQQALKLGEKSEEGKYCFF